MGLTQSASAKTWQQSVEHSWVLQKLQQDKVVMFSKSTCPYCVSAKRLLKKNEIPFESYEINTMQNGSNIQDVLQGMTGARTVSMQCTWISILL